MPAGAASVIGCGLVWLIFRGGHQPYRLSFMLAGVLYACYVGDMVLFGVNMARSTYLAKIAVRKEDIAPTLGMEVSINHTVSMSVPALGGLAWVRWGHGAVFLGAAGVAVLMIAFAAFIRIPNGGASDAGRGK